MTIYNTSDGLKINTGNARISWQGSKRPITERLDPPNEFPYSSTPRDRNLTEKLHCSRNGLYYIEFKCLLPHVDDWVEIIDKRAAVRWLLENQYTIPEDLKALAETMGIMPRYERIGD